MDRPRSRPQRLSECVGGLQEKEHRHASHVHGSWSDRHRNRYGQEHSLSYQGISDRVAFDYMERHGRARWADIEAKLGHRAPCPKLQSYWHYRGCRYDKLSRTCAEPNHIGGCPVPSHDLRNGRPNQTAYSLYLFILDIADGDLVGWIDRQIREADLPHDANRSARLRESLIGALREIYGVSDKVLAMTLSCILLGAPRGFEACKPDWPTFLDDFQRHWPTDENIYVDFVRDGVSQRLPDPTEGGRSIAWQRYF